MAAFGYATIAEQDVSRHIRPPLDAAFRERAQDVPEEAVRMVARYRERYGEAGYAENSSIPALPMR